MKFTILLITMFTLSFGLYGCGESMADSDDSNQSMKDKSKMKDKMKGKRNGMENQVMADDDNKGKEESEGLGGPIEAMASSNLDTIAGIAYHVCPLSSYTYIQYNTAGENTPPYGQCVRDGEEVACYCKIVKKQGNTFETFAFSSSKREDCEDEFIGIIEEHHCTQYNHSEKPQLLYESEINFGEDLPDKLKNKVFQ